MEENRIIELLVRKLAGEASKEELEELKELIFLHPDALNIEATFNKIWNVKAAIEVDANAAYNRHENKLVKQNFSPVTMDVENSDTPYIPKRITYLRLLWFFLILVISSAVFYFYPFSKADEVNTIAVIVAPKGVRKAIVLPDGSKVWMNADSRLSYDVGMQNKPTRTIDLSGEAYFDVVHNEARPFVINTGAVSIRVLGTAFNVRDYPADKKCETTLIRGQIVLSVAGLPEKEFLLKPAEKFVLVNKDETTSGKTIKTVPGDRTYSIQKTVPVRFADKEFLNETSWTQNRLMFDNESLEELAPKLERWFNIELTVVLKNPSNYKFTGVFTKETIEQALIAMKLIKPFNFTIKDRNVVIY